MISVVIPVYKNKELFLNNLKHNFQYFDNHQVIIINDDPQSSLKKDLINFKNIKLIENKENLGFSGTVNQGIKEANNPYILLLNSDVRLNNNHYQMLIENFKKDKGIFAISFAQKEKNGSTVGKNIIFWKNGFIQHKKNPKIDSGITAWAEGGATLIDKEKFDILGGFDTIYSPFYWEDIDLSYRAWKNGFKILFDPKILVKHHHESTIGKYFSKKEMEKIAYRNQLLFIWKNITDKKLLMDHYINLILLLLKSILKGNLNFIKGFFSALTKIKLIKRNKELLSDQDVLNNFLVISSDSREIPFERDPSTPVGMTT